MDGQKEEPGKTSVARFSLDRIDALRHGPLGKIKIGGIVFDRPTLDAIDAVGRSLTGSVRRGQEEDPLLEESRARITSNGLDVDLVTTYHLSSDEEARLVAQLEEDGIPFKRGERGLEVYGPHSDRSVDVETMLRTGRVRLDTKQESLITEEIQVKRYY